MIINDAVFGEIEYTYGWVKDINVEFCGKEVEIALIVKGEEDGKFDEGQYTAYNSLLQNWEQLQQVFLQAILDYYKQERQQLGMILDLMKIIRISKLLTNYLGESL